MEKRNFTNWENSCLRILIERLPFHFRVRTAAPEVKCINIPIFIIDLFLKSTSPLASSGADKGIQAARDSALYVQLVTLNKDGSLEGFTTEFQIPLWIKVHKFGLYICTCLIEQSGLLAVSNS